jgi:uncharacterized protein
MKAGGKVRQDIEIDSDGITLRGWFYPGAGTSEPTPCVVMAHGWGGTKEMYLDDYAEVFSAAGLAVVAFDYRGWGASDTSPGRPRQEIDPWEQVRDYQNAITYAQTRPDVDAGRIGVWGTSYSAAHAFVLGATDRRVKAVVGQVPVISGRAQFEATIRIDMVNPTLELLAADRIARANGEPAAVLPLVSDDPGAVSSMPMPDAYEYFAALQRERDLSTWRNELTARSMEYIYGYEPATYIPKISPTPLLMIVAPRDRLAAGERSLAAYETAAQPKKLTTIRGGHFEAYTGEGFEAGSSAARDWFAEHLAKD